MKVINKHQRIIHQPKEKVSKLLETLATSEDKMWTNKMWTAIRFKNGLKVNSKGGHGIIRYTIVDYVEGNSIKFQFSKPVGFNGTHEFQINKINNIETEAIHLIKMNTSAKATLQWVFAIKWLHNALIEDAFDKIESQFSSSYKKKKHSIWVKLLRYLLKPKNLQLKMASN